MSMRFFFRRIAALVFILLLMTGSVGLARDEVADRGPHTHDDKDASPEDLQDLKRRLDILEREVAGGRRTEERAHRLHPVHSLYGLRLTGGVTMTVQASSNVDAGKKGQAAISADLAVEGPVGSSGTVALVLDFERGSGLGGINFFTAPNGNPSGPNADLESFNDTNVHLTQVYYEHRFGSAGLVLTAGQLDITGYFDANDFANDERARFLANVFVNNPSIEFGGSQDFYGPGMRLTYSPVEKISVTVGVFEGDGDYNDIFDSPFFMAEVDLSAQLFGSAGNWRVYYWNRQERPGASMSDLAVPTDPGLLEAFNQGLGASVDQMVTERTGLWLRLGLQRETVAKFKSFIGAGIVTEGPLRSRPLDTAGLAWGVSLMGGPYKRYMASTSPSFAPGQEHYIEAYYDLAPGGGLEKGFHISPDLQYIINPGGNRKATDAFIYGLRLQAYF